MTQIYKVFINNYFIFFSSSLNKVDFLNARLALDSVIIIESYTNLMKLLFQNNFSLHNNIIFISDNPKVSFNQFKLNFNYITAAGGIVQNNNRDILMIYKRDNWDLPKGKIDDGESSSVAAIREVFEETNVKNVSITSNPFLSYHIYSVTSFKNKPKFFLKETQWFMMDVCSDSQLIPQIDEGITAVKWIPLKNINTLQMYLSVRSILEYLIV